jgi:hypothetical protein
MEQLIEDLSDVLGLIEEAKDSGVKVFAWYVFNEHTLKVELTIQDVDKEKEEIILCPEPTSVSYIKEMISGLGSVNIYMPKTRLIFSAEFKNIDEQGKMRIGLPSLFKVHDRRGWDRTQLEANITAVFELKGKTWNKNVFDLGCGGMSIVFSKNDLFRGEVQEIVKKMEIKVGDTKVYCECIIVNILQLRPYLLESCPYGGTRVSFKFNQLDEKTKSFFESIIFSHIGLLKGLG